MKTKLLFILLIIFFSNSFYGQQVYKMSEFGILPDKTENMSEKINIALNKIKEQSKDDQKVILHFEKGIYNFYPEKAVEKNYYISNHDQNNPKKVGLALENFNNITIEGNEAKFIFHGQMIPISILYSSQCSIRNISIDFENPHIAQIRIVKNDVNKGIEFQVEPWVKYRISKDSVFKTYGDGWEIYPNSGIAFEKETRHLVYCTSDLSYSTKGIYKIDKRTLCAPLWKDNRLKEGTIIAMRSWDRPTPGIFISNSKDISLYNLKVHYAQGMGLLAQLTENITLDGFSVCLKGDNDKRYFTTQADATHFSGCKGKITSVNGLYEGMMDDAINVHGTYLKIIKKINNKTLIGRYMHYQSWGFDWGFKGDTVQFIRSKTMELMDGTNIISTINPINNYNNDGPKEFKIVFEKPLPDILNEKEDFGIENLTWTPEVYFAKNIIRNNRARGALFSTPRKIVIENNIFDHTSGTAILLCGDCNGWYETGACRNVVIRSNKFINALTNMFQFSNAVISIYPEIPDLNGQIKYFHGGKKGAIKIINNEFETFDSPILYAKSVNGLIFRNNKIIRNNDYEPFHWNKNTFLLEKVNNVEIE